MTDTSINDLVKEVENELIEEIIEKLDEKQMSVANARQLARDFLKLLPMEDKQDLLTKLYNFSERHSQVKEMYVKFAKPIENEERERKLTEMSEHLRNGNIEHAIAVAKGGATNG